MKRGLVRRKWATELLITDRERGNREIISSLKINVLLEPEVWKKTTKKNPKTNRKSLRALPSLHFIQKISTKNNLYMFLS